MSEQTAVYRLFDANDELLYVGISNHFGQRWERHSRMQPWWPQVHHQLIVWCDTREDALLAEKTAIHDERPIHNIHGALRVIEHAKRAPGRPRRGAEPMSVVHLRLDRADWADLETVTGGQQAEITRQLVAWYLRRRGAKMPPRPPLPPRRAAD